MNRFSSYLTLVLIVWPLLCCMLDPLLGFWLSLVSAMLIILLHVGKWTDASFPFVVFAIGAVFLTYMMRVPLLLYAPETFVYGNLGVPAVGEIRTGGLYLFLYIIPVVLGIGFSANGIRPVKPTCLDLYRWRFVLLVGAFISLFLRVVVMKSFGVGMLVGEKSHGYLDRLLPYVVMIFVVSAICVFYWRKMDVFSKAGCVLYLCSVSIYTILLGSKAGLANVLFALLVMVLLKRGDVKLKLGFILAAVSLSLFVVFFVFPYAHTYRYCINGGFGFFGAFGEAFLRFVENYDVLTSVSLFSGRVSGFDGLVSLSYSQSDYLSNLFSFRSIAGVVAQGLLPGVHFNSMTMGKAVGIVYAGHDITVAHNGSVGLLAASSMLVGPVFVFPFLLFIAWLWGALVRVVFYLFRSSDMRYVAAAVMFFLGLRFLMSGNIDGMVIRSLEYLGHVVGIVVLLKLFPRFMRGAP